MSSYEQESISGFDDPESYFEHDDPTPLIAGGLYRYRKASIATREAFTGDVNEYLSPEQEKELSAFIQNGREAQDRLDNGKRFKQGERERLAGHLRQAKEAQNTLVTMNLQFASWVARASIGITTTRKNDHDITDNTVADTDRSIIGAFGDVRSLRFAQHVSLEDRVQIANEGLIKAAQTFNAFPTDKKTGRPSKIQKKFTTHAMWHIHGELQRAITADAQSGVKLSIQSIDKIGQLHRYPEQFSEDERRIIGKMAIFRAAQPLDQTETGITAHEEYEDEWTEGNSLSPADILQDPLNIYTPESLYGQRERNEILDDVLDTLIEREAGTIRLRFGLVDGQPRTLDEISEVYGVSRERIRQIESKSLSKLRNPYRSSHLSDHISIIQSEALPQRLPHELESPDGIIGMRTPERLEEQSGRANGEQKMEIYGKLPSFRVSSEHVNTYDQRVNSYDQPARTLYSVLYHSCLDELTKPTLRPTYPAETINLINDHLGNELTTDQLELFWNDALSRFVQNANTVAEYEVNLDSVSLLISRLLAERMQETNEVTLVIPQSLDGKMNYLGTGLTRGSLNIVGSLGDYAGYCASGRAEITISGNVGDFAAASMSGAPMFSVHGEAGKHFANDTTGNALIEVKGIIESLDLDPNFEGEIIASAIKKSSLAKNTNNYNVIHPVELDDIS